MRIEWLNEELTEARLTRGRLWWKRTAIVCKVSEQMRDGNWRTFWRFGGGDEVGHSIVMDLAVAAAQAKIARETRAEERNWHRAKALPPARTVRR